MRKEAGSWDVFTWSVNFDVVGLADIALYGFEELGVYLVCGWNFYHLFKTVTGRTSKEEHCCEVFVIKEIREQFFKLFYMVEVYAYQSWRSLEGVVRSAVKFAAEGSVCKVGGFVYACSLFVWETSEGSGLGFCIVSDDIVICVSYSDALYGFVFVIGALKIENFGPLFISPAGVFEYWVRSLSRFRYISRFRVLSSFWPDCL